MTGRWNGARLTTDESWTTELPAESLLELLAAAGSAPCLLQCLDPDALATAVASSRGDSPHPLVDLLRGFLSIGGGKWYGEVLRGLEAGLAATQRHGIFDWCCQKLNSACHDVDFSTAASKIGEVRAVGTLCRADFEVEPVPTGDDPTPDLHIHLGDVSFLVEIHCKQGNPHGLVRSDARTSVHYPAGVPTKGESTAENVASKFAQIKPKAKQAAADQPTILWLELQSRDWWVANEEHAEPASVAGGLFFSGGLWHAFYGTTGTPMLEHHRVHKMGHSGLFEQSPGWAAAILRFSNRTVLFENPSAPCPLTDRMREELCRLPGFDLARSRMDWPWPGPRQPYQLV